MLAEEKLKNAAKVWVKSVCTCHDGRQQPKTHEQCVSQLQFVCTVRKYAIWTHIKCLHPSARWAPYTNKLSAQEKSEQKKKKHRRQLFLVILSVKHQFYLLCASIFVHATDWKNAGRRRSQRRKKLWKNLSEFESSRRIHILESHYGCNKTMRTPSSTKIRRQSLVSIPMLHKRK